MVAILDAAVEMKLNAIVLQVRPMCDALYASKLEPWSEYLTGKLGKDPGYDPLAPIDYDQLRGDMQRELLKKWDERMEDVGTSYERAFDGRARYVDV